MRGSDHMTHCLVNHHSSARDYHSQFCARRVPKILTGAHKTQRMASALTLSDTTKMAMNFLITSYV
jgi:hypothetical protein